jgi:hypothetical protein
MENKEVESTDQSYDVDKLKPWLFYQPYLDTLPTNKQKNANSSLGTVANNEYLDLLPRQWSLERIGLRLKGTSLHDRVLAEKEGLPNEYNAVKTSWENISSASIEHSFPSLQSYDMMMAAVSSRGFAALGYEGLDVMIPMLDLLNHVRGQCDGLNEPRAAADVRYERYESSQGEKDYVNSTSADRLHQNTLKRKELATTALGGRGGIKVTAARHLRPGIKLLMTYGAKGNAALLGRYGFCIDNNVEPDGAYELHGSCRNIGSSSTLSLLNFLCC